MAREKLCVGIDIGTSAIKLCQLKSTKKGIHLEHFGMVPLPTETIVDGSLMNSARVVEGIQELVASHRIKHKQVAISISGHAVIIKKISLPQMTREELEESMQWEAEQFIPFDIADVNLDVQIVRPQSTQAGQMDVVLVAAKKDYVNEYTSVIAEAGLEPVICDVDAFAIENMFEANYEVPDNQTIALINIGAAKSSINVLAGGISSFTRDLTVGGNAFTEEIQRHMNVSRDEAEALKIGGSLNAKTASQDAVVPQEVENALRGVAETVTSELQRTLDFYAATSADPPPSKIYLCGGSARLHALQRSLQDRMGVHVEVANPFRSIEVDEKYREYLTAVSSAAAVSVGLAFRYVGDQE